MNKTKATLSATVGAGCCALLLSYVPQFEGVVLRGYKDPIGIVTACAGHTKTAILGRPYSREECEDLLMEDLSEHANGAMRCLRGAPMTHGKRAAAISFAFNVGVDRFCNSTFARKLNAGDATACAELDRWVYAGGQKLPGLVKRRQVERDMCEGRIG